LNSTKTTRIVLFIIVVLVVAVATISALFFYFPRTPGTETTTGTVTATTANGIIEYVLPTSNFTSSISANVGETFIIQLSSNAASTGYDWNVRTSNGIRYLNYTVVSTSNLPGGPQVRNYFFQTVQSGRQTITLRDERLFAPYDIAATINLQVTVS